MKKILLLCFSVILLCGCEDNEYDYTCKKTSEENVKTTETLQFSFDNNKVYKFTSNITEEHSDEETLYNSYIKYQTLYDNYNENNVVSDYKKSESKLIMNYYLDKADIDNMKIKLPYDFKLAKSDFIKSLKEIGYKCEEE